MNTQAGSARARRTAIRLLRWYPRPWRVRYEREMRALLADMPVEWRQVIDLAGAALREWVSPRAFGWPARSAAGRMQFVRGAVFFACAYSLYAVARLIAWRLKQSGFVVTEAMETVATLAMLAFAIRVFATITWRHSKRRGVARLRRGGWFGLLGDREILVWCALLLPYVVAKSAAPTPSYLSDGMRQIQPFIDIVQIYVWVYMSFESSRHTQRLRHIHTRYLTRRPLGIGPTLGLRD